MKVGDRVRVLYGASDTPNKGAEGLIIVYEEHDDYPCKVVFDPDSNLTDESYLEIELELVTEALKPAQAEDVAKLIAQCDAYEAALKRIAIVGEGELGWYQCHAVAYEALHPGNGIAFL